MSLPELFKTQISLTEWLQSSGNLNTTDMRKEDDEKRTRMNEVAQIIDFPFDKPVQFPAQEVANMTPEVSELLEENADKLCALRLIPRDPNNPKLRMRGMSYKNVVSEWFSKQDITPEEYIASFVPHPEKPTWSTIFVVNQYGIFGEIVYASHEALTQGLYKKEDKPSVFSFDFSSWKTEPTNNEAVQELKRIVSHLHVPDTNKQQELKEKLNATFSHNYLCGYFETTTSDDCGMWFIDYNRILGKVYADFKTTPHADSKNSSMLSGQTGCPGNVKGFVKIIQPEDVTTTTLTSSDILVCDMTTPAYIPLMKQAAGIITDRGGILTHAAIVSRELKKPCLVGTKNATALLRDGDKIALNATDGIVTKDE